MQVRLESARLKGEVGIIISKSYAHRALIMAALADKPTRIKGKSAAKDVIATIGCLEGLGAKIEETADGYVVRPIVNTGGGVLNAGESGSTLRFIMPVAAALGSTCEFVTEGRLGQRPMKELTDTFKAHGVTVSDTAPYKLSGKLTSGKYTIRGDVSSQYISGLLMALPLLEGDSEIIIEGEFVSKGYVDITLDVMKQFAEKVAMTESGFLIKGGQKYQSPETVAVEGDWSNAAFFLVAGAVNGEIVVRGLNLNSKQGDKRIYDILKEMGADIRFENECVKVVKSDLKGIEIDAGDIPDLVPVLCVAAACAEGKTVIKNVERLKLKESDRIQSTMSMLQSLGIQIEYSGSLIIEGGKIAGGKIDGCNDHRIVMAACVAASKAWGETVIDGAEAVQKSYPNFFTEYGNLGGKFYDV